DAPRANVLWSMGAPWNAIARRSASSSLTGSVSSFQPGGPQPTRSTAEGCPSTQHHAADPTDNCGRTLARQHATSQPTTGSEPSAPQHATVPAGDREQALSTAEHSRPLSPAARSSDRKSTRLNSSHVKISYAVFCLKKKKNTKT